MLFNDSKINKKLLSCTLLKNLKGERFSVVETRIWLIRFLNSEPEAKENHFRPHRILIRT